jgi:Sulfotransferase family
MILGCGRSGTSIFGELFDHLPDYRYYSEPPFDNVIKADFTSPLAFKVPRESEGYLGEPGLSFPLDVLLHALPGMRFFWIVRHPLDAVSSLCIGIAQDWGHHPRPPDWHDWLDRPLIERCAHHWAFINALGFAQVSKIAMVVRFEDMVMEPEKFAQEICRLLGLEPADQEPALGNWARRVQNTNNAHFVEAKTSRRYSRPNHTVRVGRWRENLSKDDVSKIVPIVRKTTKAFGYRMTDI